MLSREPDPKCSDDTSSYCDGEVEVTCLDGFARFRTDCAEHGDVCVRPDESDAFCAVSSTPDPRCAALAAKFATVCDGTTHLVCAANLLKETEPCSPICPMMEASCEASAAGCAAPDASAPCSSNEPDTDAGDAEQPR